MDGIDYESIDPGIRETVRWLRTLGYETTDSGDGRSKVGMGCALPYPNVAIKLTVADGNWIVGCTRRLAALLRGRGVELFNGAVQLSYDPIQEDALIVLTGVDDDVLAGRRACEVPAEWMKMLGDG
jgi:hypothetical protein